MSRQRQANNPTKLRILDAAEIIFMEKGYDGSRVEEIAQMASINKSQLFYYFGSKENILKELIEKHIKEVEMIVKDTFDQRTLSDMQSFEELVEKLFQFFRERENIIRIVLIELLKNSSKDLSIFELFSPLYEIIKNLTLNYGGEIADPETSTLEFFYRDIIPLALFIVTGTKFAQFYNISETVLQRKFYDMYSKSNIRYFERMQKRHKSE